MFKYMASKYPRLYNISFLRPIGRRINDWRKRRELNPISKKIKLGLPRRKVLIYPDEPFRWSPLWSILHLLNFKITTDISDNYDMAISWDDATFKEVKPQLSIIAKQKPIINLHSTDISKKRVDALFEKVFGYGITVDPLTYHGLALQKGNINAQQSGKPVQLPLTNPQEDCVYQLIIPHQYDDKYVLDYRVPVFKDYIPFVYEKFVLIQDKFISFGAKVNLKETDEVFTNDEISKMIQMCKEMGIEYAELDVMRSTDNGKIYVVDVNDTPGSFPGQSRLEEDGVDIYEAGKKEEAIIRLTKAFQDKFLKS
jgi:hypothetical protein